jgi:malate/lactate dehydrogenase
MRGLSSALSAASSACDHVRDWALGTPEGSWVSMGVISDGSYGQPEGIVYSFPCTCAGGEWSIVQVGLGAAVGVAAEGDGGRFAAAAADDDDEVQPA